MSYNLNTVQSIFKENQFSGSQGTAAHCFSTILWLYQELSGGSGGMKQSERWKICCRPTASLMGILYCTTVKLKREWKERGGKENQADKGENDLWNTTAQKKLKQKIEERQLTSPHDSVPHRRVLRVEGLDCCRNADELESLCHKWCYKVTKKSMVSSLHFW